MRFKEAVKLLTVLQMKRLITCCKLQLKCSKVRFVCGFLQKKRFVYETIKKFIIFTETVSSYKNDKH